MEDLSKIELSAGGKSVGTLAEAQTYAYSIAEDATSPLVVTRWIAGEDVDPHDLYRALDGPGRSAVFPNDEGLVVIETVLARIRAAFTDLAAG